MQRLPALLLCAAASVVLDARLPSSAFLVEVAAAETDPPPGKPMEKSYRGPLADLTPEQVRLRDALRADLEHLAGKIGERNLRRYPQLLAAADFLDKSLAKAGYRVARQGYEVRGRNCDNLEVEIRGQKHPDEIVVVGAHYDSVEGAPGANHTAQDTPDKIDYDRLARVVDGLAGAVGDLVRLAPPQGGSPAEKPIEEAE